MNVIPSETKVALLAGGTSSEREISIASGHGAQAALEEVGFPVTWLDPAEPDTLDILANGGFDVAFLCLHGKNGEDGTIQKQLDDLGIRYTGSGVEASATAINKAATKRVYEAAGLPTPPSVTLRRMPDGSIQPAPDPDAIVEALGEHCVVKAACGGSTLGVYIIEAKDQLMPAIETAFGMDDDVVIERYIAGKEYTVSVIGNADPKALPIIEIVPKDGFYDFEAKYAPGGSKHICPARLSDEATALMQAQSVAAHKALGCRGMSRTDFIVDEAGGHWILETNTIPGMTKTSLLPDAAKVAGYTFPELCTLLIELALED